MRDVRWHIPHRYFLVAKSVANRYAEPLRMVVAEFEVVADKVDTRFRPNEEVVERVELYACTHIAQQVVAAHKIGAGEGPASHKVLVEANALSPKATHQFQGRVLPQRWGIDRINIVKNWPERSKVIGEVTGCTPRYLTAYAEMLEQQEVAAEVGENTAANILRKKIPGRIDGGS